MIVTEQQFGSQLPFGFEIDWHFDAVAQERDPPARLYVVEDFKDRIAGNGERPLRTATNLPFTGAWFNSVARQNQGFSAAVRITYGPMRQASNSTCPHAMHFARMPETPSTT